MAGRYTLRIFQGATIRREIALEENDAPVDLTGYTVRAQVRRSHHSAEVLLNLTPYLSIVANEIVLAIPASVTSQQTWTTAVWDLEIESAGGEVTRVLEGPALVKREVTR